MLRGVKVVDGAVVLEVVDGEFVIIVVVFDLVDLIVVEVIVVVDEFVIKPLLLITNSPTTTIT